jgi:hypothetical protein
MHKMYHTIGFKNKRQVYRRKLAKIAEISDRNIDPGFTEIRQDLFQKFGLTM